MRSQYTSSVKEYFSAKAEAYDDVDLQPYWVLSDRILMQALRDEVISKLPEGFSFLDAGGGTGRWTSFFAEEDQKSRGTLLDLTPDMIEVAQKKAEDRGFASRIDFVQGDLSDVSSILAGKEFDLSFNFHNVLGFVDSPEKVISDIASLLKPGGRIVSFLPNVWHAAFFNISTGNLDEAEKALRGRGGFTDTMPDMHLYDIERIQRMHQSAGMEMELMTGFPNIIYPGYQETQLHGSTDKIVDVLEGENFDRIFEMENSIRSTPGIAARGNNIFVVARKSL